MKEFDLASWQRKWQGSVAMFQDPDGSRWTSTITEIDAVKDGGKYYFLARLSRGINAYLGEGPTGSVVVEPLYHHFDSGVYYVGEKKDWCVLNRAHRKLFSCGVSAATFHVNTIGMRQGMGFSFDAVKWLVPIEPKPYNYREAVGYLNKRLWWSGDRLMYLNTQIGYISLNRCLVNHIIYARQLRPLLGPQCQIAQL